MAPDDHDMRATPTGGQADRAAAFAQAGVAQFNAGRFLAALCAFESLARILPAPRPAEEAQETAIRALVEAGVTAHRSGRYAEAIARYRQLLIWAPENFDGLHLRGMAIRRVVGHAAGRLWLERAVRRVPTDTNALSNLAGLWNDVGDASRALACYRLTLAADPTNTVALSRIVALVLRYTDQAASVPAPWRGDRWRRRSRKRRVSRRGWPCWSRTTPWPISRRASAFA